MMVETKSSLEVLEMIKSQGIKSTQELQDMTGWDVKTVALHMVALSVNGKLEQAIDGTITVL